MTSRSAQKRSAVSKGLGSERVLVTQLFG